MLCRPRAPPIARIVDADVVGLQKSILGSGNCDALQYETLGPYLNLRARNKRARAAKLATRRPGLLLLFPRCE